MPLLLAACVSAMAAEIHVLGVVGAIDPGTADYVVSAIREAEPGDIVLVELDTPGGLLTSARQIVQAELGAEVPVVVYVAPTGARAASAGMFLTVAGHVAAMAPGTTIGAATPVSLGGGEAEPMETKVLEDTAAWARTVAARRDRNGTWIERAVREGIAATEAEALPLHVIDVVAANRAALLVALDGRTVVTEAGTVTLATRGADVIEVPMTLRQRVVHAVADPNVLFLFVTLGVLALYVELLHPGLVAPGALGVVLLLAAGVGLSILPFNAAGLLLLLAGTLLLGLEVFTGASGLLALTGIGSLVLGGLLLFERVPGFDLRVDPRNIVGVAVLAGLVTLALVIQVARAQRRPVLTGAEGLVGAEGVVIVGGQGGGRVRVEGEDWAARWPGPLHEGAPVRVVTVRGLRVDVAPLPPDEGGVS